MEQEEIWKPIKDFEGLYEVSNLGRVRSLQRTIIQKNGVTITSKGRFKRIGINSAGYSCVALCKNGKNRQYSLHRILAKAFIPNPENKPEIDHINTNRADCRLENLRWVTHAENMRNPLSQQNIQSNTKTHEALRKSIKTKIERKRKTAPKRVYQYSIDGEFIAEYESAREASRATGLTAMTIAEVSRGGQRSSFPSFCFWFHCLYDGFVNVIMVSISLKRS